MMENILLVVSRFWYKKIHCEYVTIASNHTISSITSSLKDLSGLMIMINSFFYFQICSYCYQIAPLKSHSLFPFSSSH